MFKKIFVPLDGSDLAEGILPHVGAMAAAFDACVTLLHVSEAPAQTAVDPLNWHMHKAEAEAYLRERVRQLRQAGLTVDSHLLHGPAAERIVEYAGQQQADLIILSSHGQGGLSEWNVSHIAQKVLQRGVTSILLVPAEHTRHTLAREIGYRRILIPLDGSRRAECVLPAARVLGRQEPAKLLLAHVTARPVLFNRLPATEAETAAMEWLIDHNRARASDYFEELAPRITADVETALPVGDSVALALHQLVREEAVDLVLLSAHGRTAQSQWPYGSVPGNFIANGSVPLLIVQDLPQPVSPQLQAEHSRRQALHGLPQYIYTNRNGHKKELSSS